MTQTKKVLVLGASTNQDRVSFEAVLRLHRSGYEVIPVGIREGEIEGIPVLTGEPDIENIDTITLYVNPQRQQAFIPYILRLRPRRIIFNPGTENPDLMRIAQEAGIETEAACTLVMLSLKQF